MPAFAEIARYRFAFVLGLFLAPLIALGQNSPQEFQTVVVKPGDTLWSIAHQYLEDPQRWDEILKYNKQLTSDPTVALPGMELQVPIELIKPSLQVAKLTYVEGKVLYRARGQEKWTEAKRGMPLSPDDMLQTEEWARARIKFPYGSVLNLYSHSMVRIKSGAFQETNLQLIQGMLRALHLHLNARSTDIVPKDEDTVYEAAVKDGVAVNVQVFNGSADVLAQGGLVTLQNGQEVDVPEGLAPGAPRAMVEGTTPPDKIRALRRYQAIRSTNAATTDLGEFKLDIESINPGVPLAGFRVQLSQTKDFKTVLVDQIFEPDKKFSPGDAGVASGVYWWRAAPIDLLGNTGRFSEPKQAVIQ